MNNDQEKIEYGLLENGLDFIYSAIDFLIKNDNKSGIKYGLLHLSAGVELVLKYRLFIENWKLLFQNQKKANEHDFKNGNFQSVNFGTCIERLEVYCGIEFNDEEDQVFKILRDKRNKMEHFSLIDNKTAIKSYLNQILSMTIDFIDEHMPIESLTDADEELLNFIRTSISDLEDFVQYRWEQIKDEVENSSEFSTPVTCPSCFQLAIVTDDGSKCLFCGYSETSEELADRYIANVIGISEYEAVTKGGEYPKYNCLECGMEAFIHHTEEDIWKCFECGFEGSHKSIDFCDTCGTPYSSRMNEDLGMCPSCIEYRLGD